MAITDAPPTTQKIDVENPATGQIVASVDVIAPERIPELVARARAAQPGCAERARSTSSGMRSGPTTAMLATTCPVAGFSTSIFCVVGGASVTVMCEP